MGQPILSEVPCQCGHKCEECIAALRASYDRFKHVLKPALSWEEYLSQARSEPE